jgi:drug/metabolite transporter (DMT)-like permease
MSKTKRFVSTGFGLGVCALICCILWGSAFAGVKTGYAKMGISAEDIQSQLVFAGERFFIAGIMTVVFGSILQKRLLLPTKKALPKIGIICLFQTILQYFFYYIGLAHTTGVKAAVIVAANVFTAIFIAALIFRTEKLTLKKLVGCVIGFSGIVLINMGGLGGSGFSLMGDGFVMISTVANGFSTVLIKKLSKNEDPVLLSGWQFTIGGGILWIVGKIFGGQTGEMTASAVMILLYLAFVSAAAYTLWSVLLKYNPVSRVAVFGFMNPICGVIISAIVLRESGGFGLKGLCSLILVCVGIIIVNRVEEKSGMK